MPDAMTLELDLGLAPRRRPPLRLTMPEPYERDIHKACRDALDRLLLRPAEWFPYPAGATQLSPQQFAAYAEIGLKRGLPDIWILYDERVYCIELKRKGGRLSKTRTGRTKSGAPRVLIGQEEMFPRLLAAGVREIVICRSVDEVLDQLERWNIPHLRRVRLPPNEQSAASSPSSGSRSMMP